MLSTKLRFAIAFALCMIFNALNLKSADALSVDNFKTLKVGCYKFTDELLKTNSENIAISNLPAAYLGKSIKKVDCTFLHHLEISKKGKSKIVGNLKVDSLRIRMNCLVENARSANSGHETHSSQLFTKVWRTKSYNSWVCGVIAKASPHPTEKNYLFYEGFYGAVLKGSEK